MQKWGENILKPTIGNESLHQDSNDNGVRIVNFDTSNNLVVRSMMLLHRNIHKYTWTSPDGRTHNQTDHILRQMALKFISLRGADYDTDHYLVVAEVWERLAASKQEAQKSDGERFNLRKLNELEVRKEYLIEITNRFAALENLSDGEDINRAWITLKRISKPS